MSGRSRPTPPRPSQGHATAHDVKEPRSQACQDSQPRPLSDSRSHGPNGGHAAARGATSCIAAFWLALAAAATSLDRWSRRSGGLARRAEVPAYLSRHVLADQTTDR